VVALTDERVWHYTGQLSVLNYLRRLYIFIYTACYDITVHDIVHCNNFILRNMFWQKFESLLDMS